MALVEYSTASPVSKESYETNLKINSFLVFFITQGVDMLRNYKNFLIGKPLPNNFLKFRKVKQRQCRALISVEIKLTNTKKIK